MKIHITKSWRKSISMKFDRKGVLQVRAPKFMLSSQIQKFLEKNNVWIEKQQNILQKREQEKKWYLFWEEISHSIPSSQLPPSGYRGPLEEKGRATKLVRPSSPSKERRFRGEGLVGEGTTKNLEKFYKSQAKQYIIPRCEKLAEKYGFEFDGIRITSAMTRWGSCSSKKTLNFSYRLVMAPKECIDYVIIHELCHLRQMNHSKKFWSEVESIMPDYKNHEKHLKEFGWRYTL